MGGQRRHSIPFVHHHKWGDRVLFTLPVKECCTFLRWGVLINELFEPHHKVHRTLLPNSLPMMLTCQSPGGLPVWKVFARFRGPIPGLTQVFVSAEHRFATVCGNKLHDGIAIFTEPDGVFHHRVVIGCMRHRVVKGVPTACAQTIPRLVAAEITRR